jgi:hypothetical protein
MNFFSFSAILPATEAFRTGEWLVTARGDDQTAGRPIADGNALVRSVRKVPSVGADRVVGLS